MIQTIIGVEGMACGMCEAHINDCIRQKFKVKKVSSSRSKKRTEILSEEPLDAEALKEAIHATGYTVTGITSEPYVKKGLFGKKQ